MIKLSILVATVPSRMLTMYPRLMTHLLKQVGKRQDVEIIGLYDNKIRTVGEKRNALLNLAQGEFLTFIDDDDRVGDEYITSIMETINNHPDTDVIVFDCITTIDGNYHVTSKYSVDYQYSQVGDQWRGKPAHTMVWRASVAKKHAYPNQNYGEDVNWVVRACADVKKEVRIDKVLYFYDFNHQTTETRGRR